MTTTLDSTQRTFVVQSQGFFTRDIFCNLADIPAVLKAEFQPHDEYLIFEYWNRKLKRCSKKHLNEMFAAHKINFTIK